jgi:hypothetical protein
LDGTAATQAQFISTLAYFYDPTGLFGAFAFRGKHWMSLAWRSVNDWKKPIPTEIVLKFEKWIRELQLVKTIRFKRWFGIKVGEEV